MNPSPPTQLPDHERQDPAELTEGGPDVAPAVPGRHRQHRFPARSHALKVLYGDDEHAMIRHTAEIAGLRPSSPRRHGGAGHGRAGPQRPGR